MTGLILVSTRVETQSPEVQKALRDELEEEARKARARHRGGKAGDERKDK